MEMKKFYFTYGTDSGFPFNGGFTEVIAKDKHEAVFTFRKKHPDRHEGFINCAFVYSEEEFESTFNGKDIEFREIIMSEPVPMCDFDFGIGKFYYATPIVKTHELIVKLSAEDFKWTQEDCDTAARETGCFKFSPDDVQYRKMLERKEARLGIEPLLKTCAEIEVTNDRIAFYRENVKPLSDKVDKYGKSIKAKFPGLIYYK